MRRTTGLPTVAVVAATLVLAGLFDAGWLVASAQTPDGGAAARGQRGAQSGLLAPRAFSEAFAKALAEALPGRKVMIKAPLQLRYQVDGDTWSTASLSNAYRLYRANPGERDGVIRHFAGVYATLATQSAKPIDARRIVPVVKDSRWLETSLAVLRGSPGERGGKKPAEPLFDALGDGLVLVYAEDAPSHLRYVTADHLIQLGGTREMLRSRAMANLRRVLPRIKFMHRPDVGAIEAGGMHEASLVLLDDVWIRLKGKIDGDPVVALPARGVLLFTGSRDADGIASLRRTARTRMRASSYPLTDRLYVLRDGKVEVFR